MPFEFCPFSVSNRLKQLNHRGCPVGDSRLAGAPETWEKPRLLSKIQQGFGVLGIVAVTDGVILGVTVLVTVVLVLVTVGVPEGVTVGVAVGVLVGAGTLSISTM